MAKLYYTDPLAAAYMAREFGILIGQWDDERGVFFTKIAWLTEQLGASSKGKYYIHPDSYKIFEPQDKDLITLGRIEDDFFVIRENHKDWYGYDNVINRDRSFLTNDKFKIIQRNNKPFFWPESEEV